MKTILEELKKTIDEANIKLSLIKNWDYRKAPDKWSKEEILGHLIDSAANNHQRFVRIQFEDTPAIRYDQNKWVEAQRYNDAPIEILINLWTNYNKHLAFVVSQLSTEALGRKCNIGKEEPVTLEFIVTDYLRHLKHHLNQIMDKV